MFHNSVENSTVENSIVENSIVEYVDVESLKVLLWAARGPGLITLLL